MSQVPTKRRPLPYLLVVFVAPVFVAILASLWPLEPIALALTCTFFGLFIFVRVLCVRSLCHLLAGMATLAILISVATSNWPLRAAYVLSRPSFDRVAAQVRAGETPNSPCWIGCFQIRKVEVYHNGVVCLWTDDNPSGPTGFVQTESNDLPFNLWSHTPLDNSWQFISED